MTRKETAEWVASLKPGDAVIQKFFGGLCILHIKNVTDGGVVTTDGGKKFRLALGGGSVYGCDNTYGEIVPATDKLIKKAEEYPIVTKAYTIMRSMRGVPYEFAVEFLDLCKKHGVHIPRW